jgi:glycosyltransferase involved in cell wall biosynthesis
MPFNRAKSALKFLEYSALGLPSICSAGEAYSEAVGSTGAGLLTANTPEAWCEALRRMATDSESWERLHANCAAVAHNNTIASNSEEIKSLWRALAGREPLPASSRTWAESDKTRAGFAR